MIKIKNLKYFIALACFILSIVNNNSYSQDKKESDLKIMIDDIIFNHLKYKPTNDSFSVSKRIIINDYIDPNPYPLIALNGVPIHPDSIYYTLNKISMKDVYFVKILLKKNATVMYGSKGINGVVLISTEISSNQKSSKKKIKNK